MSDRTEAWNGWIDDWIIAHRESPSRTRDLMTAYDAGWDASASVKEVTAFRLDQAAIEGYTALYGSAALRQFGHTAVEHFRDTVLRPVLHSLGIVVVPDGE